MARSSLHTLLQKTVYFLPSQSFISIVKEIIPFSELEKILIQQQRQWN